MGTNETTLHLSGHQGAIYDAFWDAHSETWLTAGGDGIVAEWPRNGKGEGRALLHHEKAFFAVSAHKGRRVAGTENGELFRWKTSESTEAQRLQAHANGLFALAWTASGLLISGGGDERVVVWNDKGQQSEWRLPGAQKIRCIVPQGERIFIGTTAGQAHTTSVDELMTSHPAALSLTGHAGGCYAAMWHPKKEAWMSGGRDGHVRVWGKDGEEILAFPAHEGAIYRMAIAQGKLWTASRDKTVKSWSMDDLSPLQKITLKNGGSNRSINALSASTDALLFGGDDRTGRLLTF